MWPTVDGGAVARMLTAQIFRKKPDGIGKFVARGHAVLSTIPDRKLSDFAQEVFGVPGLGTIVSDGYQFVGDVNTKMVDVHRERVEVIELDEIGIRQKVGQHADHFVLKAHHPPIALILYLSLPFIADVSQEIVVGLSPTEKIARIIIPVGMKLVGIVDPGSTIHVGLVVEPEFRQRRSYDISRDIILDDVFGSEEVGVLFVHSTKVEESHFAFNPAHVVAGTEKKQ